MKDFEFLHNITIGQYLPTGSVVHRLHPSVKMLAAALLVSVSIIATSLSSLGFACIAVLAGMKLARIPFRYAVKGIRPAVPIIVFVAILQILFSSQGDGGTVFWQWRAIAVTSRDFYVAAATALRLVVLILIISFFTLCTDIKELTHGTERLLGPLRHIRFPVHEFSMIIAVTLRFLPILSDETENLIKAQVSRGADFGKGRMGLFKRIYRMFPLFVPLLFASLRRAENMALAMEARCYTGGSGRTQLVRFPMTRGDLAGFLVVCGAAGVILAVNVAGVDSLVWAGLFG